MPMCGVKDEGGVEVFAVVKTSNPTFTGVWCAVLPLAVFAIMLVRSNQQNYTGAKGISGKSREPVPNLPTTYVMLCMAAVFDYSHLQLTYACL